MWNIHYSYARPAARTADQVGQPPASHRRSRRRQRHGLMQLAVE